MTGYGRTGRELSQSGTPSRVGRGEVLWRPALLRVPLLRGSTLVETLVMMLVAGIVFLTVMDGMTLFTRLPGTAGGGVAGSRTQGGRVLPHAVAYYGSRQRLPLRRRSG